jgi:subtilisin family serine protease
LLTALLVVVGGVLSTSRAAGIADVVLGDEVAERIDPGETLSYRLPLVAGTELDLRLEADGVELDDDEDDTEAAKSAGPAPSLALWSPDGGLLAEDASASPRIRLEAPASGTFLVEVRAGTFSGTFSLRVEGELPERIDDTVVVSGQPVDVVLEAPLGSSVRVEVRRRSGNRPQILGISDGAGRAVGFALKRSSNRRVLTRRVPVTAPGGLSVRVGGNGTYDVRGHLEDEDDDLPEGDDDREERRFVVTLAPGTDAVALAEQLGYTLVSVEDGIAVLETPEGREGFEDEDARDADERFEEILAAEIEARLQTPEGLQSNGVILGSSLEQGDVDNQAALATIRAGRALRRATGRGAIVAVVDTGIDPAHPAFAGRLAPGYDFVDDDSDPTDEENGVDDDGDGEIDEGFGHGTFVAGLVLAVAPDATILPVRVLDSDAGGSVSRVAAGIRYAAEQGADVINLSLGARVRSELVRGEVRRAQSLGVVVVSATGNRSDAARIDFPAGLSGVIAVTSLDGGLGRADFANAGTRVTVAAPGTDLIGPFPGGTFAQWSGTSFSAALVAGGVALLEERRPGLRVEQVAKRIRRTARSVPRRVPAARRRGLGGGRLDLWRLVR